MDAFLRAVIKDTFSLYFYVLWNFKTTYIKAL